jgi:hypothetical protein
MTTIAFLFNLIALVLGILVFLVLLLSKGKTLAFRLLTLNVGLLIIFIGYSVILFQGWLPFLPHLLKLPVTLVFLLGPVSYLFIRALLNNENKFKKYDWIHLIPFFLYFFELLPFLLKSGKYKLDIINAIGDQNLIRLIEIEVGFIPNRIHTALMQLSNCFYLYATYNYYKSYCKLNTVLSNKDQNNKKYFARVIVMTKLCTILIAMFAVIYHKSNAELSIVIINFSLSTLLIAITIMLLINPDFLYGSSYSIVLNNDRSLLMKRTALLKTNLLAMTNSNCEANIFFDTKYNVIYYNVLAENRVNFIFNKKLMVGANFKNIINSDVLSQFIDSFNNALKGETISFEKQLSNSELNITNWFRLSLNPVYGKDSILCGVSLKIINVDNLKKQEIINLEYIDKLEKIAWQQAHILRAPVANLIGLSRLLKNEKYKYDKTKRAELIDTIYKEVSRLNNSIKAVSNSANQIILENLNPEK